MKSLFSAIVLILFLSASALAQNPVFQHLQKVSVTVNAEASYEAARNDISGQNPGSSSGSGVVVVKGDQDFVLTAAHVVANLRRVRIKIVDGVEKKIIEFDDATVYQKLVEGGREVGLTRFAAKVIKYSDATDGHDIAVLQLYKKSAFNEGVKFSNPDVIPEVGSAILHVGSLLGDMGSNSLTMGIVSQQGRLINKRVFDQSSASAMPGSSGGGMFNDKGEYVGMLTRGASDTFNLFIPIRRVKEWAKESSVEWLLNQDAVPDLSKIQIEN